MDFIHCDRFYVNAQQTAKTFKTPVLSMANSDHMPAFCTSAVDYTVVTCEMKLF